MGAVNYIKRIPFNLKGYHTIGGKQFSLYHLEYPKSHDFIKCVMDPVTESVYAVMVLTKGYELPTSDMYVVYIEEDDEFPEYHKNLYKHVESFIKHDGKVLSLFEINPNFKDQPEDDGIPF